MNPEVDRLYNLVQTTFDLGERVKYQAELERIASADVALGALFYDAKVAAVLKRVTGLKPRPNASIGWDVYLWDVTS